MKKCFLKRLANGWLNLNLQCFGALAPFLDFLFITWGSMCVRTCVCERESMGLCVCACTYACECVRDSACVWERGVGRGWGLLSMGQQAAITVPKLWSETFIKVTALNSFQVGTSWRAEMLPQLYHTRFDVPSVSGIKTQELRNSLAMNASYSLSVALIIPRTTVSSIYLCVHI